MPEIFRFFGYSFFFYSREHEPIHIHVEGSNGYAIYDLIDGEFCLREKHGIKVGDQRKIETVEGTLRQVMEKLRNISFDNKYIYAEDASGRKLKQSILWYPSLMNASEEQRNNYDIGFTGFHWRDLDEDISFESFEYDDAVPSKVQEFFLLHREINVAEFAKRININATLLRNYINGFKKPSAAREAEILDAIHNLGIEYCTYGSVSGYSSSNTPSKRSLSDKDAPVYGTSRKPGAKSPEPSK